MAHSFLKSRITRFVQGLLFLIFAACFLPVTSFAQDLTYAIYAGGSEVGTMRAKKMLLPGDAFSIKLETDIDLPFKHIHSVIETRYAGHELVYASSKKYVNNRLEENITVSRSGAGYKLVGASTPIEKPVLFSVALLYHSEPVGQSFIFSERLGRFVTIRALQKGDYLLRQPDGKTNLFTYRHGICTEMQTEMLSAKVLFRLSD